MANDRFAFFVHCGVQHGKKMRSQLAVRAFHGKVFLVVAHHRDQYFFGKLQILRLKIAEDHRRPLGQMEHRLDQRLVFTPVRSGNGARRLVQRLANNLPALRGIDHYERLAQCFDVALRGD